MFVLTHTFVHNNENFIIWGEKKKKRKEKQKQKQQPNKFLENEK